MTDKKRTKKAKVIQPPKTNVVNMPERFDYSVDLLEDFLELVFHVELDEDEEILAWITKGIPGYPISENDLYTKLPRTPLAKSLYFSTATSRRDHDTKLYNRKTLFKRLHVLVLDDIGSKVEVSKLPDGFDPTYIIESSEGNFQYGYVLDEPIEVLEQAEALIQLVYEAGYSDKGGRMANKLVRLPDGINGKKGVKENFAVNLVSMSGPLWSPKDILNILDLGVTWAEVQEDVGRVNKTRAHKGVGLTAWSPIKPTLPTTNGIVDPVLEWLYDENMVKQETNEWVTVTCPWAEGHTTGGDWASYSPLGWGGPAYQSSRGFHCFHEHCSSKHGSSFVEFISAAQGPQVPVTEHAAHLTSMYTYDPTINGVWQILGTGMPTFLPLDGFKNKHPEKTWLVDSTGKPKLVAETGLFIGSKARVTTQGVTYDPSTPAKIVTDKYGINMVNLYTIPPWGDGDYMQTHVNTFMEFLTYLIPNEEGREFYLDWLGAKVQDMAFRGPAILMIAPTQGTGRTTLGNMMKQLFGNQNVEKVPFERLTKGSEGFNDWITKPMIITDETLAIGQGDSFYKVYEKLKELIDTTPEEVRINPKFGKQRFQTTYSSFMLFSNHENAMVIAQDDRRIYVIDNVTAPASGDYFVALNAWLKEDWEQSIWRWLRQRDVDVGKLLQPTQLTTAKKDMLQASKQALDVALDAIFEIWPSKVIATFQIKAILINYQHRLNIPDASKFQSRVNAAMSRATRKLYGADNRKHRVDGMITRLRAVKGAVDIEVDIEKDKFPISEDMGKYRQAVSDALDEYDF